MDALRARMGSDALRDGVGSEWTVTWSTRGCSAGADGVAVDFITVPAWMLCGNGCRNGRSYGFGMDALREQS